MISRRYNEQMGIYLAKLAENSKLNKPTNADRIRSMTDEELAEWMNDHDAYKSGCYSGECGGKDCQKCWLDWLKAGDAQ